MLEIIKDASHGQRRSTVTSFLKMAPNFTIPMTDVHDIYKTLLDEGDTTFRFETLSNLSSYFISEKFPKTSATFFVDLLLPIGQTAISDRERCAALNSIGKIAGKSVLPDERLVTVYQVMLKMSNDPYDDARVTAVGEVGLLLAKYEKLSQYAEEALDMQLQKAEHDSFGEVRSVSILGMGGLAMKNRLPENRIIEVLQFLRKKTEDAHDTVREAALFSICELIEQEKIPAEMIIPMYELLKFKITDTHHDSRNDAYRGLCRIVLLKLFPRDELPAVVALLITAADRDTYADVRTSAFWGINKVISKNMVQLEHTGPVVTLLFRKLVSKVEDVKVNALTGLYNLITKRKFPSQRIYTLLTLIMKDVTEYRDLPRTWAFSILSEIAALGQIPHKFIEPLFKLFMTRCTTEKGKLQNTSIRGISNLMAEHDVTGVHGDSLLNTMLSIIHSIEGKEEIAVSIRGNAVWAIAEMFRRKHLSEEHVAWTYYMFMDMVQDEEMNETLGISALYAIRCIAEKNLVPADLIDVTVTLLLSKTSTANVLFRAMDALCAVAQHIPTLPLPLKIAIKECIYDQEQVELEREMANEMAEMSFEIHQQQQLLLQQMQQHAEGTEEQQHSVNDVGVMMKATLTEIATTSTTAAAAAAEEYQQDEDQSDLS